MKHKNEIKYHPIPLIRGKFLKVVRLLKNLEKFGKLFNFLFKVNRSTVKVFRTNKFINPLREAPK